MRRAPYMNLMKGLIGAWCPSVGVVGGSKVVDSTKHHRDLQLSTYEAGSGFGASGSGVALDFHPGWGGAYSYDVANVPYYLNDQRFTVSAWHNTRSYDDGAGYSWNNAIFEIVTDYTYNGQRFILQNFYEPTGNATYVFTDGVFGENNLSLPGQLPLNQWIHFCMVVDNFSYRFFVDGKLTQSGGFATDFNLDVPLYLNVGYRDGWDNFDGYIDDVRLYNRSLSDAEVHQLATRRGIGLTPERQRRRALLTGDTHDGAVSPYLVWPEKEKKRKKKKARKVEEPSTQEAASEEPSESVSPPLSSGDIVSAAVEGADLAILRERLKLLSVEAELSMLRRAAEEAEERATQAELEEESRRLSTEAARIIRAMLEEGERQLAAETSEILEILDLLDSDFDD